MSASSIRERLRVDTPLSRKPRRISPIAADAERAARKLESISREISDLEIRAKKMRETLEFQASMIASAHGIDFCIAPPPSIAAAKTIDGIPDAPGVYFIWKGSSVVYVGKSKRLKVRISPSHPNIKEGDSISFLLFDELMIDFKEFLYIGLYLPPRNFSMKLARAIARARQD